jgi:hypothetical protein
VTGEPQPPGSQPRGPQGFSREDLPQTLAEWHLLAFYLLGMDAGWPPEKCERAAERAWPLTWYKLRGIPMGSQYHVLGWLAVRYARDFTVAELADELWEVMEASEQNGRKPWRTSHALDYAARACRFTERADAAILAASRGLAAWAERALARTPVSAMQVRRRMARAGEWL